MAGADHPAILEPAPLLDGVARGVARGHAGGAQHEHGGGREVLAVAGARALQEVRDRRRPAGPLAERRGVAEPLAEVPRDGVADRGRRAARRAELVHDAVQRLPLRAGTRRSSSVGGWSRSIPDANRTRNVDRPSPSSTRTAPIGVRLIAAAVSRSSSKAPWGSGRMPRPRRR